MAQKSRWFETVSEITTTLVSIPSVSPDVEGENRCAEQIYELLTSDRESLHPIFWNSSDGRINVACLLKSNNPKNSGDTIILMGHFDTVGVDDFARFGDSSIAFQPDELAKKMKAHLENKERDASEESAYQALQSGEWMFGRGSVDMKSGVAVNIAVICEFARRQEDGNRLIDELAGNLLFLACPDEETESAGILSAVSELRRLRDEQNLNYLGVINTDYTAPRGESEDERYIYSGTIGKLLPSFYILGVRTHVGEVFRGVDAARIAAALVGKISLHPEWIDTWKGSLGGEEISEVAQPPVALYMRDLKPSYNVETIGEAFVYVNWLTLTMTPEQAMEKMNFEATAALDDVIMEMATSFKLFESIGGQAQPPAIPEASVLSYELLFREAAKQWTAANGGGDFSEWLESKTEEFSVIAKDSRELSRLLVAELVRVAQISGLAIIAFFSPPYYPSMLPEENELTRAAKSASGDTNQSIQFRGFYPYISDLSYVRLDNTIEVDSVKKNMPLFDIHKSNGEPYYILDSEKLSAIRALDCPVINIGPFGRDAHGLYERVHMPYSFETVPEIIFQTISKCLQVPEEV